MAIRKIDKAEIDFSKVYGTSYDAMQQDGNTVKINQDYWGDEDELEFDDETGLVSENGIGLGFINQNDLISIDKIGATGADVGFAPGNPVSPTVNNSEAYDPSIGAIKENESKSGFTPGNPESPTVNNSEAYDPSIGKGIPSENNENSIFINKNVIDSSDLSNNSEASIFKNKDVFDSATDNNSIFSQNSSTSSQSVDNSVSINGIKAIDKVNETVSSNNAVSDNFVSGNSISENSVSRNSVSNNDIERVSVSSNSVSNNTVSNNSVSSNSLAQPSDFNFKYEDSNILAAKAKNMGFTDDQIKIAIGISRHETGNYQHLAGGYNYGGVSGKGDAGSMVTSDGHRYARFSSKDKGMDVFLTNLKNNYFDMGLNTPESMARKYLGHGNTSNWINNVYRDMK